MNKNLIRILAIILLLSPWFYLGSTLHDALIIIISITILLCTVDIYKKKKKEDVL